MPTDSAVRRRSRLAGPSPSDSATLGDTFTDSQIHRFADSPRTKDEIFSFGAQKPQSRRLTE